MRLVGDSKFLEVWTILAEEAGAKVARKLSRRCKYAIVQPNYEPAEGFGELASSWGVRIVSTAWFRRALAKLDLNVSAA